jgi:hypothetical protein
MGSSPPPSRVWRCPRMRALRVDASRCLLVSLDRSEAPVAAAPLSADSAVMDVDQRLSRHPFLWGIAAVAALAVAGGPWSVTDAPQAEKDVPERIAEQLCCE